MPLYRNLLPVEADAVIAHYQRLGAEDRVLRFFGQTSDAVIAQHCRRIDWRSAVLVGCFVEGTLRGVAELRLERPYLPAGGELAISVEKAWQGRGVGTELLRRALVAARNRALRKLTMLCLLDNQPMQHIARKFADELRFEEGSVEVEIALPHPTPATLLQEGLANGAGLTRAWLARSWLDWAWPPARRAAANDRTTSAAA